MSSKANASAVPAVYTAINKITARMAKEGIAKNQRNKQQGYAFRGIDDIYRALSSALAEHSLCILPRVLSREVVERETQRGGTIFYTALEVEYDFVSSEDGSVHTVRVVGEAMDSADKSSNKAMSAAYKYACLQTFCIPTEGDNDADASTPDPVVPRNQPAAAPPKRLTSDEVKKVSAALQESGWTTEETKLLLKSYSPGTIPARLAKVERRHMNALLAKIADADEHARITETARGLEQFDKDAAKAKPAAK